MDVLSDVLRVFELRGTLYFRAELGAPFGLAVPENAGATRFHVALRGACYLAVPQVEPVQLCRGDLALVPHGTPHTLADEPTRTPTELDDALARSRWAGQGAFRHGGQGEVTTLVCGHFAFERDVLHPLLDALPRVLHLPAREGRSFTWLDDAMSFLGDEAQNGRPGSDVVLERLAEILFIQMLRAYVERAGDDARVLAAIADPHLGRALAAMHEDPARRWSLLELARRAGHSRSVFAERFAGLVGVPPMQSSRAGGWSWRRSRSRAAGSRSPRSARGSDTSPRRRSREHSSVSWGLGPVGSEPPGAPREPRVRPVVSGLRASSTLGGGHVGVRRHQGFACALAELARRRLPSGLAEHLLGVGTEHHPPRVARSSAPYTTAASWYQAPHGGIGGRPSGMSRRAGVAGPLAGDWSSRRRRWGVITKLRLSPTAPDTIARRPRDSGRSTEASPRRGTSSRRSTCAGRPVER